MQVDYDRLFILRRNLCMTTQVTHPTKQDVYVNESIDQCWHEIQNQVNEEIILRRSEDSSRQLPPLLPPPSGLEMFGLASASIVQVHITFILHSTLTTGRLQEICIEAACMHVNILLLYFTCWSQWR